jgi:anti-sigma B factor antagonist
VSVQSREESDVLVAYFTDSRILDEAKIQQIGAELTSLVTKTPKGRLLLNFKNVQFMSSAMLGKIILLNKKCQAAKVDLRLCEIAPAILDVFKMMKLHKVLNIQKTEEKAIESYDKKSFFG